MNHATKAWLGHAAFAIQSLLTRDDVTGQDIQCPALIVAVAQDRLRSTEEASELLQSIPRASMEIIEDCGYMIPLEQPEKLARLVLEWTTFWRAETD